MIQHRTIQLENTIGDELRQTLFRKFDQMQGINSLNLDKTHLDIEYSVGQIRFMEIMRILIESGCEINHGLLTKIKHELAELQDENLYAEHQCPFGYNEEINSIYLQYNQHKKTKPI